MKKISSVSKRLPSKIRVLLWLFISLTKAIAQQDVFELSGTVRDAESKLPLPHANIRILGTTRGTTSNIDGAYRIHLPPGSHLLVFSFLGYRSDTLRIIISSKNVRREIFLQPALILLPEVTVFGDARSPAEEIIRRAIAKKKETLALLRSYEFSAYTKTINKLSRRKGEPADSLTGFVLETHTKGYWKAPDNYKEIVVARKQTANFPAEFNLFGLRRLPNFNDDRVLIYDRRVVGPTAPDAFDYYSYQMLDTVAVNNVTVWRIQMTPKSSIIPLFRGVVSIADQSFLVMEVDVQGNDAFNAPPFTDIQLRQQFALYEDRFWLPIQSTLASSLRFSIGPATATAGFAQHSVISEYQINNDMPDNTFDQFSVSVLPTADRVDSTMWSRIQAVPLTSDEMRAYQFWDSVMAVKSWRRDLAVFLLKAPLWYAQLPITEFSDLFHFNRVEGTSVGVGLNSKDYLATTRVSLRAGYGFADQMWKYGLEAEQFLAKEKTASAGGELHRTLINRQGDRVFSTGEVTGLALFTKDDPLDYFEASGWSVYLRRQFRSDLSIELRFLDEQHQSAQKNTDFSLLGRSRQFRSNPPIVEGRITSSLVTVNYDTRKFIDLGIFKAPDNTQDSWTIEGQIEYTDSKYFKSDFDFTRAQLSIHRRQRTLGRGTFSFYLQLCLSNRYLPPQRLFDLPAGTREIVPAGAFKALRPKELAGDKMAMLQVEYNVGSTIFRALRLPLVQDLDFILYTGSAWSDLSARSASVQTVEINTARKLFHEVGFGIGSVIMRLDFTWRLTHRTGDNFAVTVASSLF